MVGRKGTSFEVFLPTPSLEESFIGKGIGVSGGALSGRIVFTLEDIQHFRQEEPETPLILVRSDTVPEDIREISLTEGLQRIAATDALQLIRTARSGFSSQNEVDIRGG